MRTGQAGRLPRALVGCHPRRWRERYREEMLDVLDQHQTSARTVLNLAVSVLSTHVDPAYRTEALSLPRLRRAALISVVIAAPLALILGPIGYGIWQDDHWHPAADEGLVSAAFSAHAAILVTAFGVTLDGMDMVWDVTDLSRPRRLSQFEGGQPTTLSPGRPHRGHRRLQPSGLVERGRPQAPGQDSDAARRRRGPAGTGVLPGWPDPSYRLLRPGPPVGRDQPGPAPAAAHPGRPGNVPTGQRRSTVQSAGHRVLPRREHPGRRHRHRPGHLVERRRPGARLPHR